MSRQKLLRTDSRGRTSLVAVAALAAAVMSLLAMAGTASAAFSGVAGWGHNELAQLGDGTYEGPEGCGDPGEERSWACAKVPHQVGTIADARSLAAGTAHGLAALADGTVLSWGGNGQGQLGNGTDEGPEKCGLFNTYFCRANPAAVSGITTAEAVAAGETYSLALLENGTVMGWGSNYAGQLGDGTTEERDLPTPVSGLSNVVAIAAGHDHSLALLGDGTVRAWGTNNAGQLGNGTTTNSDVPVPVSGLSEVVAIAAGPEDSLALLEDGTVMAWGANDWGQLGIGTSTGPETCKPSLLEVVCSRLPVQVSGIDSATAVAISQGQNSPARSFAVLEDGTVQEWGADSGPDQCTSSINTYECRKTPAPVSGLSHVVSVAAGWGQNLALLEDGTVKAWGTNNFGQVGDGTTTWRETPVEVDGLSGVSVIAAGSHASYASGDVSSLPAVTSTDPNYGPIAGGTSVTLTGTDLEGATAVKFGSEDAESFTVDSPTEITATSPPGTGVVYVRVTTPAGTSPTGEGNVFNYSPAVTKVEPNDGPVAGGTSVMITGGNFTGATEVKFGSADAESFVVNSNTEIHAVSPAGHGIVDVTVIGPGGTSTKSSADRFGYGPIIDRIEPRVGPAVGGTEITISGYALTEVEAVKFGSVAAASFTENPDGTVSAVSPAFTSGSASVPVTLTTPNGDSTTCECSSVLPENYFFYAPTVTSVDPDEGPGAGGGKVTIHGTGFYGVKGPDETPFVESVHFGSKALTCSTSPNPWESCSPATFEVKSETEIVATVPSGYGTVNVKVTTHGGTSPVSPADHYSYEPSPPSIVSESTMNVTEHDATLLAEINPNGLETAYRFQIDTTGHFSFDREDSCLLHPPGIFCADEVIKGESLPPGLIEPAEGSLPEGTETKTVLVNLASIGATLQPGTTYHYRVIASNSEEVVEGPAQTFTTKVTPQSCAFSSAGCSGGGPGIAKPRVHCKKGKKRVHGRCVKKPRKHRHHRHSRHKRTHP